MFLLDYFHIFLFVHIYKKIYTDALKKFKNAESASFTPKPKKSAAHKVPTNVFLQMFSAFLFACCDEFESPVIFSPELN